MAHENLDQSEVQERLWNEVEKHQIGMLGLLGDAHHFQPMTAFVDREANEIWFYTYKDTDLARSLASHGRAAFIFQTRELQACIDGQLVEDRNPERLERHWSAHVAAWYPGGKDDPRLTMLRLDCTEAAVWLTEVGPVRYAWEIARANATKRQPDLGDRADLNFH